MNHEYLNVQLNKLVNNLEKSLEQIDFIEKLNELEGGSTQIQQPSVAANSGPVRSGPVPPRPMQQQQSVAANSGPVPPRPMQQQSVAANSGPVPSGPIYAQPSVVQGMAVANTGAVTNTGPTHMENIQDSINRINQGAQTSITAKKIDQDKFNKVINELSGLKAMLAQILNKALEIKTGVDVNEHNKDVVNAENEIGKIQQEIQGLKQLLGQQGGSTGLVELEYNL